MTSAIVLPPLSTWVKNHITTIIQATTQAAFNQAFDDFLEQKATITVNGQAISRDAYKAQLQGENFEEVAATVTFNGAVEVPKDATNTVEAGAVGLFYTAVISEAILIRDAPVQRKVTASLNVVIEQDPTLTPPPPGPIHGFFDGRRVSKLNQVIIEGPNDSSS